MSFRPSRMPPSSSLSTRRDVMNIWGSTDRRLLRMMVANSSFVAAFSAAHFSLLHSFNTPMMADRLTYPEGSSKPTFTAASAYSVCSVGCQQQQTRKGNPQGNASILYISIYEYRFWGSRLTTVSTRRDVIALTASPLIHGSTSLKSF